MRCDIGLLTIASFSLIGGQASAQSPETLYTHFCLACHGADGVGVMPGVPDLSETGGALAKTDEQLLQSLLMGSGDPSTGATMPPKGGNPDLSEEDLRSLIDYMRREFLD